MAEKRRDVRKAAPVRFFAVVAGILMAGIAALALRGSLPWPAALLIAINGATIVLYGYDKAIAGGTKTRVPEAVLHLLAVFGGTPGAFLAQRMFRHKTSKGSFQAVFWLIVLAQLILAVGAVWIWRERPGWLPDWMRGRSPGRA